MRISDWSSDVCSSDLKTRLFRALTGLWPWGTGRITVPGGERMVYVPRGTPYLPRGSLREILAYPGAADAYDDAAFKRALDPVGLGRLVALLDVTERWVRELRQDEIGRATWWERGGPSV